MIKLELTLQLQNTEDEHRNGQRVVLYGDQFSMVQEKTYSMVSSVAGTFDVKESVEEVINQIESQTGAK